MNLDQSTYFERIDSLYGDEYESYGDPLYLSDQ